MESGGAVRLMIVDLHGSPLGHYFVYCSLSSHANSEVFAIALTPLVRSEKRSKGRSKGAARIGNRTLLRRLTEWGRRQISKCTMCVPRQILHQIW